MSNCTYVIEKEKEKMLDFFVLLNEVQNNNRYKDISPISDVEINNKISDSFYRLQNISSRNNQGLRMFFIYRPERNMTLFDWLFRMHVDSYTSGNDIVQDIENMTPMKIVYESMRFNDPYNNFQDSFYQEIVNSNQLFMKYMNGVTTSTEIRWEIMSFIQNPLEKKNALVEYIKIMYEAFDKEYTGLTGEIDKFNNLLEASVNNSAVESTILEYEIEKNEIESKIAIYSNKIVPPVSEVKIIGTIFAPGKIFKFNTDDGLYFAFGIGYMEYCNKSMNAQYEDIDFKELFKGFTDDTRAQIIDILRDKECYNGELSKMLDVPMSSLTHHMEILNRSGFVTKRTIGKRTYYKLNKKQFINAARMLRKFVENYDI